MEIGAPTQDGGDTQRVFSSLAKCPEFTILSGSFAYMNWFNTGQILAMGQPPGPSGTQPDPRGQALSTIGMLVIMVVMFYFVLIRPQSKKAKEHAQMLKTVRPGDKIVTSGGVVGVVITVKEKTLSIRSADSKFEITKAAISEITERSGEPSES
ncbi:MAG TPA: preprotein translocase subunit YajC [Verrucomicrobiae bacterium]